jgi:hypothetical protein
VIKSRRVTWAGHVVCIGKMKNTCKVLVRKSERKMPLERPSHRQVDDIKIDLRGNMVERCGLDSSDSVKIIVNMVMNFWVI